MRNPKFDFSYLKSQVSIGHVLSAYGLDRHLKLKNHQLYGPCPLHRGDNPSAFRVDLKRGLWHCFTSCGGGDIVKLIRHIENCSDAEAALNLYNLINDTKRCFSSHVYKPLRFSHNSTFSPFKRTIPLNPHVSFLQDIKKISPHIACQYETGICDCSPFLRGLVAVRIHDLCGNPLGYCGRRLDPHAALSWGKWRFPKNFPKKSILYNSHRAQYYKDQGVIVVECPWGVMRFAQSGIFNVVALLGTSLSSIQSAWLSKSPAVILMLDGDQAGKKATPLISEILSPKTHVLIHELPHDTEPEDLHDNELKAIAKNFLLSF